MIKSFETLASDPGIAIEALDCPGEEAVSAHGLQIARHIQHALVPPTLPSLKGLGISAYCRCAKQVGGDFYDVIPLEADSTLLAIADVMGKGVPAALVAASIQTLLRSMVQWTQNPAELLARLNRVMFPELSGGDMFATVQIALIDARRRRLHVAAAGHCPLLLTGPHRTQRRSIPAQTMPIGIVRDLVFAPDIVTLPPGCCALMYTDGIPDTYNARGEFFGQRRLETWFHETAYRSLTAAALKDSLVSDLTFFQGDAPCRDDQTFLLLADETVAHSPATAFCGDCQRWEQTPW